MIIELFLNAIYGVFKLLTAPINIPDMPPEAMEYIDNMFGYLEAGAGIVANYTPFAYIMILFGVVLAVDVGIRLYHFVMWVIRKIPMANIS